MGNATEKNCKTLTNGFTNIFHESNRKPNLIETDDGKKFVNKSFTQFLKNKDFKRYTRHRPKGAIYAERFNRTIRDLLQEPVFGKWKANYFVELPKVFKNYDKSKHSSSKMALIQASKKSNENEIYKNIKEKLDKKKPKTKLGDLVTLGNLRNTFSKGHNTKWTYQLHKITKTMED